MTGGIRVVRLGGRGSLHVRPIMHRLTVNDGVHTYQPPCGWLR